MSVFSLKSNSTYVKAYYAALKRFHKHGHTTEGNTRSAFADLLKRVANPYDWHLVEEYHFKGTAKQSLRADGALVDALTLVHGLWEAKDTADDLEHEIKAKVAKGYPLTNILFQSPLRAILYQDNRIALDCDLSRPENLIDILQLFFEHRQPHEVDWEEAVLKFSEKIPDLAQGVTTILEAEHKQNADFHDKFQAFAELCRQSINPDLTDEAIRKMLVQHLLTERIFRKVFNNQEFLSRNVIAAEIEKVIRSITNRHFSRDEFLKPLDRFYTAIERAAEAQQEYTEKQHFLNAVYEKFFQSFDKKQADTHGIVYTPQPVVDFMVRSVEEVLKSEFGKSLSDEGVHILDPFTGTGNFITRIMQQIKRSRLPQKYAEELHCNEIMLLPYYIASMNIEHAYMEKMGEYRPFDGICLVDTFDLTESQQATLFSAENTARVARQRASPIRVVIGNPPYNAGQVEENDLNKNRPYPFVDGRVAGTFARLSSAKLKRKYRDHYIRAIRWSLDRLAENDGIVALVTNSSFIEDNSFDGVRAGLRKELSAMYCLDLGGNVTKNPSLSGTTHNVFGIRVGVAITILVKLKLTPHRVFYKALPWNHRRSEKESWLEDQSGLTSIGWQEVGGEPSSPWTQETADTSFSALMPLANTSVSGIFRTHSLGISSNRDTVVYNFSRTEAIRSAQLFSQTYNKSVDRISRLPKSVDVEKFVEDADEVTWSEKLKKRLKARKPVTSDAGALAFCAYRPFTVNTLYYGDGAVDRESLLRRFFPLASTDNENSALLVPALGGRSEPWCFASRQMPYLNLVSVDAAQTFPFYTYNEDSTNRQENITDWALDLYRTHYADPSITKWDIFHSTYALLHHPEYRTRYAANLKRELPRIPFPPDLHAFAGSGKRLMELHIDYEQQPEYPLEEIEHPKAAWTLRVERMSLSKNKTELRYNEALTLRGIPPAAFDYRLGNRSALEWVIDQYRVSTDARSGIVNDPNRPNDERYILRLIGQVITVSLETIEIVNGLPSLGLAQRKPGLPESTLAPSEQT